ncbi:hypothetical protein ACLOJK_016424 [Asimina triloba]
MADTKATAPPISECCMCGDFGLSDELFRCTACLSRLQHRYCSDLYPRAESYRLCNWCLNEEDRKALKELTAHTNSNSNSSSSGSSNSNNGFNLLRSALSLHSSGPIKKQRSPDRLANSLKKSLSADMSNVGTRSKQVFRGKVRRYKLLEEVSS